MGLDSPPPRSTIPNSVSIPQTLRMATGRPYSVPASNSGGTVDWLGRARVAAVAEPVGRDLLVGGVQQGADVVPGGGEAGGVVAVHRRPRLVHLHGGGGER